MIRVKECLQGQHGFESQEECQWALKSPTDVEGFVSGKIWAIARVGDTLDVHKVKTQRLDSLLLDEARAKYSEIVGFRAANELTDGHQHQNQDWESQERSILRLPRITWRMVASLSQDTTSGLTQEPMCYKMMGRE